MGLIIMLGLFFSLVLGMTIGFTIFCFMDIRQMEKERGVKANVFTHPVFNKKRKK